MPEPWSGQLATAPILFFGSNPSISMTEEYPRWSWPQEKIEDFFRHRFGGGSEEWVTDALYTLQQDGTYNKNWVRYWAGVRQRAQELLPHKTSLTPGIDYVLSEVVHCKSKKERGVSEALEECAERYLRRVIAVSGARVIVFLGKYPRRAAHHVFDLPQGEDVVDPLHIGQNERYFTFLPHPNARTKRTFKASLTADHLATLRAVLAN